MSARELVVLGTASQVPTRQRHHNGYLLRFDTEGILLDPGEGTQLQMIHAGVSVSNITAIAITHFHGDHSLGLAGMIQRISLDLVEHEVTCYYPAAGQEYFDRLRHASAFYDRAILRPVPLRADGTLPGSVGPLLVSVAALEHSVPAFGYRFAEPDGRSMLPRRLAELGISGTDIGRLRREGAIIAEGRRVTLEELSVERRGQVVAFVMDTRLCPAAYKLAAGADLLIAESTYLDEDSDLAAAYGHLTAGQAGRLAAESGVRELVLTHFSRRYQEVAMERFCDQAAQSFRRVIHVAADLDRIPLPRRPRPKNLS